MLEKYAVEIDQKSISPQTVDIGVPIGQDAPQNVTAIFTDTENKTGINDFSAELERLNAEKMTAVAELERAQNKLSNESFVSKAPAALVEKEKEKVHKYSETIASIEQQINAVKNLM